MNQMTVKVCRPYVFVTFLLLSLGPGPGRYGLPPTIGFIGHDFTKPTSPAYSFHGGPSVDLAKTPGPCRYNSTDPGVYLPRQPAFSMLGRHSLPRDATKKPGPGTYNPEKVTVHKARAPAFSLGIRHSEFVTLLVVNVSD
uniref:CIMAP1 family member D n=1 Tax=Lates calcarifer TaxID=8187 RepID=A0A4W6G456_LATCA